MLSAGVAFCVGVVLNAAAQEIVMLILGRVLLGCGVGFANQVPILHQSIRLHIEGIEYLNECL